MYSTNLNLKLMNLLPIPQIIEVQTKSVKKKKIYKK